MRLSGSLHDLIKAFGQFPGVGPKTSERLVFWLLQQPKSKIHSFIQSLQNAQAEIYLCPQCHNFTTNGEHVLCSMCTNPRRDQSLLCVVADIQDLLALEATGFMGTYHVLGGLINPLRNITASELHIQTLIDRILAREQTASGTTPFQEIILAFDPNQEGELTVHYLKSLFQKFSGIKITRLARGLPQGGDLDYADELTLREALKGRRDV